jgi:hypothetical protein
MSLTGFRQVGGQWEIEKDPDAILDYTFDWSAWLDDDSISAASPAIADSDTMTLADETDHASIPSAGYSIVGDTVIVWLKGGAARDRAAVTCTITTDGGRTDDRTVYVRVRER